MRSWVGSSEKGKFVMKCDLMDEVLFASPVLAKVDFIVHDLRHTFPLSQKPRSYIPAYALKRLLNHKMNHDVPAAKAHAEGRGLFAD